VQRDPPCPICYERAWEPLLTKTYRKGDARDRGSYLQRQYRILFEAWFPGVDHATITSVLCRKCGFVCYIPRPTADEVDRKYEIGLKLGRHSRANEPDNAEDRMRASRLYADVSAMVPPAASILDYGGGDGRLMTPFLQSGHKCYIVDYVSDTVQGVERVASTVDSIEPNQIFDVMILSHVLEHVAEPRRLLSALRLHHRHGGILFVEVPMQLWRKAPPRGEPLTHINFFSPDCVRYLLESCGYDILMCGLKWHYVQRTSLVVRAIARCATEREPHLPENAAAHSLAMLKASPWAVSQILKIRPWRAAAAFAMWLIKRLVRRVSRKTTGSSN
jgi:SAM-dependent methyltransferase